jgi:hypothetical protein
MRLTTAYFAGVGTVVVAVSTGLGGGLLISNIVSPHEPKVEMSKLELRMSSKPIPVSNAPQSEPAIAATKQAQPAEAQGSGSTTASAPPAASPPQGTTQAATSEQKNSDQIKAPENAFARARDADVRREARRAEQKRRAERRQHWAERRRPRQDQELRDVEAKVREATEPRQAFAAEPVKLETPRITLFEDD